MLESTRLYWVSNAIALPPDDLGVERDGLFPVRHLLIKYDDALGICVVWQRGEWMPVSAFWIKTLVDASLVEYACS